MATISTRLDDQLKVDAEIIADEIGIPLSTAINVFLKQFIAYRGFPFQVLAPTATQRGRTIINADTLDMAVKKAVSDEGNTGVVRRTTYLDPETNQLVRVAQGND